MTPSSLISACLLAGVISIPSIAHSQAQPSQPPPPPPSARPYSPGIAGLLSIGTTFAGWGLFAGGIAVDDNGALAVGMFAGGQAVAAFGPSAGHVYAGEYRHALIASTVRAGAILLLDIGVAAAASCAIGGGFDGGNDNSGSCGGGATMLIGLGVAAGVGLYDWIDAPRAARRANRRAARRAGTPQLAVVPLRDPRHGSYGLALGGAF